MASSTFLNIVTLPNSIPVHHFSGEISSWLCLVHIFIYFLMYVIIFFLFLNSNVSYFSCLLHFFNVDYSIGGFLIMKGCLYILTSTSFILCWIVESYHIFFFSYYTFGYNELTKHETLYRHTGVTCATRSTLPFALFGNICLSFIFYLLFFTMALSVKFWSFRI